MAYDALLKEVEKEFEDFTLDDDEYDQEEPEAPGEDAFHCRDAFLFYTWCSKAVDELRQNPIEAWIKTYQNFLQIRYWEYLKRAPSKFKGYWAKPGEKKCINDIWFETFSVMEDIRLSQQPQVFKEIVEVEVQKSEQKVTIGAVPVFIRNDNNKSLADTATS